jgi:hypothetical protein
MRNNVVKQAQQWLGRKESDGGHKGIIDIYNAHKPLARGYKVKYTDEWCATFVSAVGIKLGYTQIIPTECSCGKMIELFKKLDSWVEDDTYKPKAGDIVFYDWEDTGKGDNKGTPNHVGIVEKVSGTTITVIEGNYGASVKRRYITLNGRYIRGYGVPKYIEQINSVKIELNVLKNGSKGNEVKTLQRLLLATGYDMNGYGADGSFGPATESAIKKFQKNNGLAVDGTVGPDTWNCILKKV